MTDPARAPRDTPDERYVAQIYDLKTRQFRPLLKRVGRAMDILIGAPMVRNVDGRITVFVETPYDGGPLKSALLAVDPETGERKVAQIEPWSIREWLIDPRGALYGKTTYDGDMKKWTLSLRRGDKWVDAFQVAADLDLPFVAGLSADGSAVIVEHKQEDATVRQAVLIADAKPGTTQEQQYEGAGLLIDPLTQRIIGTSLGTMTTQYTFFNRDDQRKWDQVATGFPDEHVELVAWSDNRARAIAHIVGPKTGAVYMLVDLQANTAVILGNAYSGIEAADVAKVLVIKYPAADGLEIFAYLTVPNGHDLKNLPLIVLPAWRSCRA
jgi:dipeptidyl aminopeptidase/acylaminoacyl peptidase